MWIDNSEYHNLIIGSTGAGKTQVVVNPLVKILAKAGESMIITDPKGEIYEEKGDWKSDYNGGSVGVHPSVRKPPGSLSQRQTAGRAFLQDQILEYFAVLQKRDLILLCGLADIIRPE